MLKRVSTFSILGVLVVALLIFSPPLFDYYNYMYNKKVATEALDILLIHDDDSYQKVKKKVCPYLSEELRESTFGPDTYEGVITPKPELRIMSVKGDLSQKGQSIYTYKVSLVISYLGNKEGTFIVTVTRGRVSYFERV